MSKAPWRDTAPSNYALLCPTSAPFIAGHVAINEFVAIGAPLDILNGNKFVRPVPLVALSAFARQQNPPCDIVGLAPVAMLGGIFFDMHLGLNKCRVVSVLVAVSLGSFHPFGLAIAAAFLPSFPSPMREQRAPRHQNQPNRVWGRGQSMGFQCHLQRDQWIPILLPMVYPHFLGAVCLRFVQRASPTSSDVVVLGFKGRPPQRVRPVTAPLAVRP